MNKRRREARRLKQGKSAQHIKRKRAKELFSTKTALFSEIVLGLVALSIGSFWAYDFIIRYNAGGRLGCSRYMGDCLDMEIIFATSFIFAGLGTLIFAVIMVKTKARK